MTGKLKFAEQAGMTLIEALVAVFIFGVAMTAIFSVTVSNSNTANLVKNSYIASGLAQEGVELVRNLRDGDWIASRSFGAFGDPGGSVIPDGDYQIQWDSNLLSAYSDNYLKKTTDGLYNYVSGNQTLFKRKIRVTTIVPGVEKKIAVDVTWYERGSSRAVTVEDHLYNWW
jgi:prepilin-type N-terminal cleavage/methylation domain-containing protein